MKNKPIPYDKLKIYKSYWIVTDSINPAVEYGEIKIENNVDMFPRYETKDGLPGVILPSTLVYKYEVPAREKALELLRKESALQKKILEKLNKNKEI